MLVKVLIERIYEVNCDLEDLELNSINEIKDMEGLEMLDEYAGEITDELKAICIIPEIDSPEDETFLTQAQKVSAHLIHLSTPYLNPNSGMIEKIQISREESAKKRKELNKEGWMSAHYWTRHGWSADILRLRAKKEKLRAKILITQQSNTWYYHKSDVAEIQSKYNLN